MKTFGKMGSVENLRVRVVNPFYIISIMMPALKTGFKREGVRSVLKRALKTSATSKSPQGRLCDQRITLWFGKS